MSETDSFIEEVTEEVRKDKLFGYFKKYGWIAVVVILAVVGATAYLEWQKSQRTAAAQMLGDRILAATDQDAAAQAKALSDISGEAGAAEVLLSLRRAAALVASDDKDGALALLDQISQSEATPLYQDLASLKALMIRGKDMDAGARDQALARLAEPGQAFRPLAMEQQAIVAIEGGDNDKALGLLRDVFLDSQATEALRSRVQQMIVALGGEVPASAELQLGQ